RRQLRRGRPGAEALKLRDEALTISKDKLGPDSSDTIRRVAALAESLMASDRGAEAVPLIDEYLRRAGKRADLSPPPRHPRHPRLPSPPLRHFQKARDAGGCRAAAEMWERLTPADANGLYNVACCRAVTALVIKVDPKTPDADTTRLAAEEADRAMAWLHK